MHLVVITSVLRPRMAAGFFSDVQRFDQLLGSIRSVRGKIPHGVVVVIEGTMYTDEQSRKVKQTGADEIFHVNVDAFDQQYGECTQLHAFFSSELFARLHREHGFLSISKLSGRYFLTENFVFHYDGETCICKVVDAEDSYSGKAMLLTRFYSLPIQYLRNYTEGLERCRHQIFLNVEHSFFLYGTIPLDKIDRNLQKINVAGYIAPNGQYVED
jgi:hypothetical protein